MKIDSIMTKRWVLLNFIWRRRSLRKRQRFPLGNLMIAIRFSTRFLDLIAFQDRKDFY